MHIIRITKQNGLGEKLKVDLLPSVLFKWLIKSQVKHKIGLPNITCFGDFKSGQFERVMYVLHINSKGTT